VMPPLGITAGWWLGPAVKPPYHRRFVA